MPAWAASNTNGTTHAVGITKSYVLSNGPVKGATVRLFDMGKGVAAKTITPPAGFDFAKATDAQLAAVGVPKAFWRFKDRMHAGPPITGFKQTGASAQPQTGTSQNWSGDMQTSGSPSFSSVEGWYTEPGQDYATCSAYQNSYYYSGSNKVLFNFQGHAYWVGMGGWNGADKVLTQAGTWDQYSSNTASGEGDMYDAYWWETVPLNYAQYPQANGENIEAPPGDELAVADAYIGEAPDPYTNPPGYESFVYEFAWYNYTTGVFYPAYGYVPLYDATTYDGYTTPDAYTAEFIDEVPESNYGNVGLVFDGVAKTPNYLDSHDSGLAADTNENSAGVLVNGNPMATDSTLTELDMVNPYTGDTGEFYDPYDFGAYWEDCY
jgi:hypothetical protein